MALYFECHHYFLEPRILVWAHRKGNSHNPFYDEGHVKIQALRESVRQMKKDYSANSVPFVMRINLPIAVEEQLVNDAEVPDAWVLTQLEAIEDEFTGETGTPLQLMLVEMIGLKSGYQAAAKKQNFQSFSPPGRKKAPDGDGDSKPHSGKKRRGSDDMTE